MRKKMFALLLALMLLLSGCSGSANTDTTAAPQLTTTAPVKLTTAASATTAATTTAPATTQTTAPVSDPATEQIRQELLDSGSLLAAAFLGYAELPTWSDVCVYVEANGFTDVFPFLSTVTEDHAVLLEGGEVYVLIPAEGVTLTVSEYLMSDTPTKGDDLLTLDDGQPLILRGNVSEIVPNLFITASKGDVVLEYSPCLSGMDGSLVLADGVIDLTPYELIQPSDPGFDPLPDAVYCGTWYARHSDSDATVMALTLTLNPDGTAEYSYGWPDSGILEKYTGTWAEESRGYETGDMWLILNLYGGPVDDLGNPYESEQAEIECCFEWELESSALLLRHVEGSSLLNAPYGDLYSFLSFDGYHMVNTWTHYAEYQGWYYDLELIDNGEGALVIRDDTGELARYEGWWYTQDDLLTLDLILFSGVHPENPEADFIWGDYLLESWSPNAMTLRYSSGAILTPAMEESTLTDFVVS